MSSPVLSLPLEVISLIVEELQSDFAALTAFRLSCRRAEEAVNPIFYRVLSLHNTSEWILDKGYFERSIEDATSINSANEHISRLLLRLKDPNDTIVQWVQHLMVGPFSGTSTAVSEESLNTILSTLTSLKEFSWNSGLKVPNSIVTNLQRKWPSCRLHIRQSLRHGPHLDEALLSSPQLRSLTIRVIAYEYFDPSSRNEFPQLTEILCANTNLERLDILLPDYMQMDYSVVSQQDYPFSPTCLHLQPGRRMAPLRSLAIDRYYNNQLEHVARWIECMDWSQLRFLSTGQTIPLHLVRKLTGRVPGLEGLELGFDVGNNDESILQISQVDELVTFLSSVRALRDITCVVYDTGYWPVFWDGLMEHQGQSLRTLRVRNRFPVAAQGWGSDQLSELLKCAPHIQELDIEIELEKRSTEKGVTYYIWPEQSQVVLSKFRNLHRLDLLVPLEWRPNPFVQYHAVWTGSIDEDYCKETMYSLFQSFIAEGGKLDVLCARFWRRNHSSYNWHLVVRRNYFPLPGRSQFSSTLTAYGHRVIEGTWDPFG